jgi:hypothetical protein
VITQSEIPDKSIIFQNIGAQLFDPRLILEMDIAFQKPSVELNDLTKGQMLAGSLVKTTNSLDKLYRFSAKASGWSRKKNRP